MRQTVTSLEQVFTQICNGSYPLDWDENHITYQLMKELRRIFSNRRIHFNSWSKIVNWRSFKNRGKLETDYGDIALLVTVQFSSGEILKGVVNIEAKRDNDSSYFESMDIAQLNRIWTNAPYSHLLLYMENPAKLTTPCRF